MTTQIKFKHDSASNWTSNNPVLSTGEIGVETDTGKMKVGDGVTAWSSLSYALSAGGTALTPSAVGTTVQAYDATLDNMASAATTVGTMFIGDGTNFVEKTASEVRTALGTGAVALENGVTNSIWSGTLPVDAGGTNATNTSTARTNLGLAIGSDVQASGNYVESGDIGTSVQAYDSNLTSFVSTFTLPTTDGSANQFLGTNGSATLRLATVAGGLTVYSTEADLPVDSTASNADLAFVTGTDQFYTYYNGAWYYVATSELATYSFQGSNYGYTFGTKVPALTSDTIQKFSLTTQANSTDIGNLTVARGNLAGCTSSTHGYGVAGTGSSPSYNTIDKFPFSTDADATDVGDLPAATTGTTGQSSSTHGYSSGGSSNYLDKFSFTSDGNATDIGNLVNAVTFGTGCSSTTYGYACGGFPGFDTIQKFPFSTDTNATTNANLTNNRYYMAGISSSTHGYVAGGFTGAAFLNVIEKFPFSTDTNATDVGDLTATAYQATGVSATDSGYTVGGRTTTTKIDTFPFATDTNATTSSATLSVRADNGAGAQY